MLRNQWLLAAITVIHRFLYVSSGGYIGGRVFWIKFLLLIHVGRRSGRTHATPLLYVEDDDNWIVTASNAGNARYPAWWFNLQDRPGTQIQVGRRIVDVLWRQATREECARLWPKLAEAYPYFPEYLDRAEREIPVLILERSPEFATRPDANAVLSEGTSEGAPAA